MKHNTIEKVCIGVKYTLNRTDPVPTHVIAVYLTFFLQRRPVFFDIAAVLADLIHFMVGINTQPVSGRIDIWPILENILLVFCWVSAILGC